MNTNDSNPRELVFVLGGARSGKSSWAQRHAEDLFRSYVFLATAEVLDEEMAQRVARHQAARGPGWELVEEPLEIAAILERGVEDAGVVLVDCLTVWLSNVMLKRGEEQVPAYQEALLRALSVRKQAVILVSNEVGSGIVPEHPLGRTFRDLAGSLNQAIAALADRVVYMVAGLPLYLKGAPR
jgi:adenosylcobinamide kinase/adenosylcobinamide-phosphate guanylyltransferase